MAWFKTGGGKEIDFGRPDIVIKQNLAASASVTVPITQRPKYIVYSYVPQVSNYFGGVFLFDLDTLNYTRLYYGSNGFAITETTFSGQTGMLIVTDTSVKLSNYSSSATIRLFAAIYY